jgi:hypothetical protein
MPLNVTSSQNTTDLFALVNGYVFPAFTLSVKFPFGIENLRLTKYVCAFHDLARLCMLFMW